MWLKGIVMKIKDNYAIVLTDDNEYTKIKLKNNLSVGQKIMFTTDDILINQEKRGNIIMMRKLIAAAAVFVFTLVGGLLWQNASQVQVPLHNVVAIVTVDINPSIQISVDADNKVVEAIALNDDGEALDLTGLIDMNVEDAVEEIVTSAREAGFLDVEDLVDDYVLITTVPVSEDEEDEVVTEEIEAQIQNKITNSEELQNVNVAMIEATMAELNEAKECNVPVGIVAANGGVIIDDEFISVKDFFSNKEKTKAFMNNGQIIEKSFENQVALVERYLNALEAEEIDVDAIKETFLMSKKDFFEAKKLFEQAKKEYHEAIKSGDEQAIAEAKQVFENAEKFKDYMEENKDNVEDIKEIIKKHYDNDEDDDNDDKDHGNKGNENNNGKGQGNQDKDKDDDDDDNNGKGNADKEKDQIKQKEQDQEQDQEQENEDHNEQNKNQNEDDEDEDNEDIDDKDDTDDEDEDDEDDDKDKDHGKSDDKENNGNGKGNSNKKKDN